MGPPEKDHSAVVLGLICRPYGTDVEVCAVRGTRMWSLRDRRALAIISVGGD